MKTLLSKHGRVVRSKESGHGRVFVATVLPTAHLPWLEVGLSVGRPVGSRPGSRYVDNKAKTSDGL